MKQQSRKQNNQMMEGKQRNQRPTAPAGLRHNYEIFEINFNSS
jgi:hypothetical protein